MANKCILIVCDGLGDRPIKQLGDKTPLEAAKKPNLNKLTKNGICGLMNTIDVGIRPGSDVSHLALLGYDPAIYYSGRGPIEALGLNMHIQPGDIALRGNFGTVGKDMKILDRRTGRIEDVSELCRGLNGMNVDGVKFFVSPGTMHRAAVVMRGHGLSDKISENDPHVEGCKPYHVQPLDHTSEAEHTAKVLNKFLDMAHEVLQHHSLNEERVKKKLQPANYLLVRGAGRAKTISTFQDRFGLKAACIAGAGLYKGLGRMLGMEVLEVEGATGTPQTNVRAKFLAARKALNKFDFVFVHVKPTDSYGEDGNWKAKKGFIEKIDKAADVLLEVPDALIVITADHSTSSELKAHTGDPVPLLISGSGVRVDGIEEFGERQCAKGGIGRIKGVQLMPEIVNLLGKAKLYGA